MGQYADRFDKVIRKKIEEEGLVDMKLCRAERTTTEENLAKGALDLMDAPTVEDPDFF